MLFHEQFSDKVLDNWFKSIKPLKLGMQQSIFVDKAITFFAKRTHQENKIELNTNYNMLCFLNYKCLCISMSMY